MVTKTEWKDAKEQKPLKEDTIRYRRVSVQRSQNPGGGL